MTRLFRGSSPIRLLLVFVVGLMVVNCDAPPRVSPPSAASASIHAININTASEEDLRRLPYIGEKTAAEIVEFRTQNGRFHRPEQLLLLRGVSEKRFREIRQYVAAE
jgi:competence ComEA-like helix-hairpin-helix protein